jgi:hypothetical protein
MQKRTARMKGVQRNIQQSRKSWVQIGFSTAQDCSRISYADMGRRIGTFCVALYTHILNRFHK